MKKLLLILVFAGSIFVSNAQSPTITSFSPTSGAHGTLVTINGTNLDQVTSATIGGANAIILSNSGTQLVGFVMPDAVTGLVSILSPGGKVSSTVNFNVTPTDYPSRQEGYKLTVPVPTGKFGGAISISSDAILKVLLVRRL
jgi:hypothetical protein